MANGPIRRRLYSRYFSVVFLLLGALLLLRGRGELRRLAVAGLIGALALNTLFTLTLWPRYDLRPTAHLLAAAEQANRPIAYLGNYEGQFHFEGRLQQPIKELFGDQALQAFAHDHPDGLIVTRVDQPDATDLRYALLVQPFRSSWLVVWPAMSLADLRTGHTPPEPLQPTQRLPGQRLALPDPAMNEPAHSPLIARLRQQCDGPRDGALLRFSLGNALLNDGDAGAAIDELRRAVDFDPAYSAAWKLLGKACLADGDPAAAAEAWRQRHRRRQSARRQAGRKGNERVPAPPGKTPAIAPVRA